MNIGNWQRDLLRIMLYAAGVVIAFLGVPTLVVAWVALIKTMCTIQSMARVMSEAFGPDTGVFGWMLVIQPALQTISGILLVRWSGWFARVVFPDQPTPSDT